MKPEHESESVFAFPRWHDTCLDRQGCITIPFRWINAFIEESDERGHLVICRWIPLRIYTCKGFEQEITRLREIRSTHTGKRKWAADTLRVLSRSEKVAIGEDGVVKVPDVMLGLASFQKPSQLVILSMDDYLEIWEASALDDLSPKIDEKEWEYYSMLVELGLE